MCQDLRGLPHAVLTACMLRACPLVHCCVAALQLLLAVCEQAPCSLWLARLARLLACSLPAARSPASCVTGLRVQTGIRVCLQVWHCSAWFARRSSSSSALLSLFYKVALEVLWTSAVVQEGQQLQHEHSSAGAARLHTEHQRGHLPRVSA